MLRRLFATFIEHQALAPAEMLPSASPPAAGSFGTGHPLESLNWLFATGPCFPVDGGKIQVFREPAAFYDTLVAKCASATDRIVLASLYLGTGPLEQNLIASIRKNLQSNNRLRVNVLLDFTRGTRGAINSKTALMPLLHEGGKNVRLSLYHTPVLRGLTKRLAPARWNELLGIQHMKVYLFDDTVIVSGANLSHDYFVNRQDRYVMIEDRNLANFYADFIEKVQEFSLQVNQNADVELHPKWNLLPFKSDQAVFATKARRRLYNFVSTTLRKQEALFRERTNADTWIFPLFEMGQLGIHHDSVVTKSLLSTAVDRSHLKLATGYFNLTESYMDTLINSCAANCTILMAHPNANGFQGAKGPAGGIPAAYSLIARKFYNRCVQMQQHTRVALMEFQRPGWSYHAKGLWYYLPDSVVPNVTVVGSSNFGERSVNRDLETQICLVTCNNRLQNQLQNECDNLFKLGAMAEQELLSRPVPRWVRLVVWLFKNFF